MKEKGSRSNPVKLSRKILKLETENKIASAYHTAHGWQ
jgi:hypothetical protein